MKKQIEIASEVNNSSRTSTLAHETRRSQTSRGNFSKTWIKAAIFVFLIAQFSCTSEKVFIQNEDTEWWQPILEKHNLKPVAYNNLGNVFEMGLKGNSINNGICTLKGAIVLIRNNNNRYMLIEADTIHHNIQEGIFEIKSGMGYHYKMDSDLPEVTVANLSKLSIGRQSAEAITEYKLIRGDMKINH